MRPKLYFPTLVTPLLILLMAGCRGEPLPDASAADGDVATSSVPGPSANAASPIGPMSGTTTVGTEVELTISPDPPRAGSVRLSVQLSPAPEDRSSVSIDLVAPDMPAHGVVRHDNLRWESPNEFLAELPVPMEGVWRFYVNLDVGLDAAPFEVAVGPGESDPHRHPGEPEHDHHLP